jgi:DNA modification methylase
MEISTNVIYCGDNLEILRNLPDNYVDLIYADPPFFSGRNYEVIWKDNAELRQFDDRFEGKINTYKEWMKQRLQQCHRVLKPTGSMYLHCDWHANAHLRLLMDEVFGENNFQNEIIWNYGLGGSSPKRWQRKHDNILFYSKSTKWVFNPHMVNATSQRMVGQLKKDDDVWDIPSLNNMAKERLGYPTQKPECLLERIIEASSNKGDLILDPFCGCGTAIAVAHQLQRKWIGIDVSPTACRVMQKRLKERGQIDVKIIGMPTTAGELTDLTPFEFQNWVIDKLHGIHNNKKTGDKGIDGWVFGSVLNSSQVPVQVKQEKDIGRNVVDNFHSAIRRVGKSKGFIYALSFGKGANDEVSRLRTTDNIDIQLVKVETLLS